MHTDKYHVLRELWPRVLASNAAASQKAFFKAPICTWFYPRHRTKQVKQTWSLPLGSFQSKMMLIWTDIKDIETTEQTLNKNIKY